MAAPAAIIGEAVLSFLGLGIRPPTPSLGVMLASAQPLFRDGPWLAVVPRHLHRGASPWRSTCSATACATRSTRRESPAADEPATAGRVPDRPLWAARCWRWRPHRPVPHRGRPGARRRRRSRFDGGRPGGAGAGRRVRLRQERHRDGADPAAAAERAHVAGSVRLGDRSLLELPESGLRDVRGRDIAYVFQEPMTSLNPVLTVGTPDRRGAAPAPAAARRGRRAGGRPSCSTWSASRCRRGGCGSTRTSSPAACASG